MIDFPTMGVTLLGGGGLATIIAWIRYLKKDKASVAEIQVDTSLKLAGGWQTIVSELRQQIKTLEEYWQKRFQEEQDRCEQITNALEEKVELLKETVKMLTRKDA